MWISSENTMWDNVNIFRKLDVWYSVVDPDPKDPHHFAGYGSIIFSMDPNLNLAHFHHSAPLPSHLIFHPSSLTPPPSSLIPPPSPHLPPCYWKSYTWLAKQIWIRIRISMKSGIRIRICIKTFWIRHTGMIMWISSVIVLLDKVNIFCNCNVG